jgi:general secretion pathway protein H
LTPKVVLKNAHSGAVPFLSFGWLRCVHSNANCKPVQRVGYRSSGFTLIELLVVLVVLALFSGMVVLSIGDSFQRKVSSEAERLQALLIAASDEAIFTTNEFGFHFTDSGYQVLRWNILNGGWIPQATQAFKPHQLPDGMVMRVSVEGFAMPVDDQERDGEVVEIEFGENVESVDYGDAENETDEVKTVDVKPQILVLSSGELSVFSVRFEAADEPSQRAAYEVLSDGFSQPRVKGLNTPESDQ